MSEIRVFLGRELAPADGEWIDAEELADRLENWDEARLGEPAITDFEGWDFGHEPSFSEVEFVLKYLEAAERNGNSLEAAQAYWKVMHTSAGDDPESLADQLEEAYRGEFRSPEEFAQTELEDFEEWQVPKGQWFHPANYVDWERVARDLMMDYFEEDGYYFRSF